MPPAVPPGQPSSGSSPPGPPPQHCPSRRELDDLELLLSGALEPTTGFNEPHSPVTLTLPIDLEPAAAAAGAVELTDPEGLPLARAPWPSGPVELLARPEHGPFRRLYLAPAEVRERHAGRTVVPVWSFPSDDEVEVLRRQGPLVLVALAGHGARPSTAGLLRGTLALAGLLPDAEVVAVPLARRPGGDDVTRRVLTAYGVTEEWLEPAEPSAPGREPHPPPEVTRAAGDDHEPGVVLFFTGLSGSGKSTLAQALMDQVLERTSRSITSLDGDVVRRHLSKGLGFGKEDRETNILRIGWVAAEISRHGGLAVCSPIAPFDDTRRRVRAMVEEAGGRFFLVHVATPLEECERRDRKGLYAKARAGEIPEFTGISSPYEEPRDADVVVDTTGRSIGDALDDVLRGLAPMLPDLAAAQPDSPGARAATEGGDLVPRPLRILFVCTANICRSPYMEAAARAHLAGRDVVVTSAGTHGFDERPADAAMRAQLRARGIEDPDFRSRPVTRELVDEADVVLTAETSHRLFLLADQPEAFRKIFTLGQLGAFLTSHEVTSHGRELVAEAGRARGSASSDLDVADPYGQGDDAAATAARHIDDLLAVILPALVPAQHSTAQHSTAQHQERDRGTS